MSAVREAATMRSPRTTAKVPLLSLKLEISLCSNEDKEKQSQRRQQVETGVITACECWGGRCEWKQGERQWSVHPAGVKRRHPLLGLHGKGGSDDKEPQNLTLQVFTGFLATSLMMIKQQEA